MSRPAYPKYKPSGVEWLGDVPEHWQIKRLTFVATKVGSGKTPRGGATAYQEEGVMLIRSQNVHDNGLRLDDVVFIDDAVDEEMRTSRVYRNDVLLNITGASLGRCSVYASELPANVNQHVCIIRLSQAAVPSYVHKVLVSQLTKSQIFSLEAGSSREGLNFKQVRNLVLPFPPHGEQTAIAAFLDRETAKIDRLIAKKRELIERLQEKRQALISRTVTRGLPPDAAHAAGLNPNPRTKDSGIKWLGEVPEHWEIVRLGRKITLQRGVDITKSEQSNGVVPVVSSGGIASYHDTALVAGPGVIVGRKGTAGNVLYVEDDFWPHDTTLYVREFGGSLPRYVFYKLLSMDLASYDTGSANPTVNRNLVHPTLVSWPPPCEQSAIAAYLDADSAHAERIREAVDRAIDRLQELRSALITAAVTGKIDVRESRP